MGTEYHKLTTCALYYALKCSNYTPTYFEPLIGSSSGRVTISQKSCDHTVGCVCVICEIVTLHEDEPINGSKHVGV
jgi:hypothetical protein